jgi:hypothetical protein
MWILMVEAGVALFMFVLIVWWTMFAGRKPDSPARRPDPADHPDNPAKDDTPGA